MARTSISIDSRLLAEMREKAARNGRSVSAEISYAIEARDPRVEERLDTIIELLEALHLKEQNHGTV